MKNAIVAYIRQLVSHVASFLNRVTKGRLRPTHITIISLLGHLPVAWALVTCRPILAAVLLGFFSILDALDGALARVQKTASISGMYYDAVSDRTKEVIVFSALAVYATNHIDTNIAWQVVAVLGTSLLVSYIKAKGEMALAGTSTGTDVQKLNRTFGGGLASYEVRVTFLVVGLLFDVLLYVLPLLIILNIITVITRFLQVNKELKRVDSKGK
jgi:CDP-diacylglycerol--glycerol-3-phosphate 3-phosphatidyltransferase